MLDAAQTAQKAKNPIEYVAILESWTASPKKYSSCGSTIVKNNASVMPATINDGQSIQISLRIGFPPLL